MHSIKGIYSIFLVLSFAVGRIASQSDPNVPCQYESILDAIPGGLFDDTNLFKLAVKLSGQADKLPPPGSGLGVTVLVPTNKAFLSMLWNNGFFIPILDKVNI